jgi:hypothetical protein
VQIGASIGGGYVLPGTGQVPFGLGISANWRTKRESSENINTCTPLTGYMTMMMKDSLAQSRVDGEARAGASVMLKQFYENQDTSQKNKAIARLFASTLSASRTRELHSVHEHTSRNKFATILIDWSVKAKMAPHLDALRAQALLLRLAGSSEKAMEMERAFDNLMASSATFEPTMLLLREKAKRQRERGIDFFGKYQNNRLAESMRTVVNGFHWTPYHKTLRVSAQPSASGEKNRCRPKELNMLWKKSKGQSLSNPLLCFDRVLQ